MHANAPESKKVAFFHDLELRDRRFSKGPRAHYVCGDMNARPMEAIEAERHGSFPFDPVVGPYS